MSLLISNSNSNSIFNTIRSICLSQSHASMATLCAKEGFAINATLTPKPRGADLIKQSTLSNGVRVITKCNASEVSILDPFNYILLFLFIYFFIYNF